MLFSVTLNRSVTMNVMTVALWSEISWIFTSSMSHRSWLILIKFLKGHKSLGRSVTYWASIWGVCWTARNVWSGSPFTFSIWIDFYTEPDFKLNHISLEYLTIFCLVFENVYICIHMNTFVWNSEYFDIWSRHFVWIFWYLCEYFDTHISFALPLNFWPSNIFRADLAISRTKKKNSFPQKSMHIESF